MRASSPSGALAEHIEERGGCDEAEDRVAEEFEAFVVLGARRVFVAA